MGVDRSGAAILKDVLPGRVESAVGSSPARYTEARPRGIQASEDGGAWNETSSDNWPRSDGSQMTAAEWAVGLLCADDSCPPAVSTDSNEAIFMRLFGSSSKGRRASGGGAPNLRLGTPRTQAG